MSDHLRAHDAALARLQALHPKKIDLSLDRMRRLCAALGDPQDRLPPTVHVAGTNGKGSTVAFMRSIAEAAGLKVHVFTSPHLVRFAERIRLGGKLIEDDHLADILDRVEAANDGQPITFFEITTAAALVAFAETPADLLLLEVGLGGVLDATNVIPAPRVSVIAPVDIDHREFLGNDIATIAGEKAGIIKRGARTVSARQQDEAQAVIEAQAERTGSPLTLMGRDFDAWSEGGRLLVQMEDRLLDLPEPSLFGAHQVENAGVAVAAILALADPRIDESAIAKGVAEAVWPARFQRLTAGPFALKARVAGTDFWLDGGHNPHAAHALADALGHLSLKDGRPVALIVGLLANKDAAGFFEALAHLNPVVFTTAFEADAAADPVTLALAAKAAGLRAVACPDVDSALAEALMQDGPPHIVAAGSLYLAGEILARSEETWPR
ncbi:bifunctional folylpolyglutamate synthase/dihydrofolate synthase [Caulobacter sp. NIBR2454]|uniref:bifunctional folylpolyglutamate synthase/dihydrofolate synthase n=1 Tax=Caulobacter sp. NIBR2454 TaxID=3015996 RepID=UPI0022B68F99|nr:folylpolyglutamate synthase/dihydrofolate synthase family protein [Caulobacter sp. NIBR2454]